MLILVVAKTTGTSGEGWGLAPAFSREQGVRGDFRYVTILVRSYSCPPRLESALSSVATAQVHAATKESSLADMI